MRQATMGSAQGGPASDGRMGVLTSGMEACSLPPGNHPPLHRCQPPFGDMTCSQPLASFRIACPPTHA